MSNTNLLVAQIKCLGNNSRLILYNYTLFNVGIINFIFLRTEKIISRSLFLNLIGHTLKYNNLTNIFFKFIVFTVIPQVIINITYFIVFLIQIKVNLTEAVIKFD